MPEIRPFRAWRYAGRHRDLSALIAPPYDVIPPELEEHLRARDPHNVVRLILPHDRDGQPGSRYQVAAEELESWARAGVLEQDPEPAFYPYRQTYRLERRHEAARVGFLGLLGLQPFGEEVLAHERTLEGPREDRFRLIQATRANLGPVFVLFEDRAGGIRALIEHGMSEGPLARAERPQGEFDELWRLGDSATTRQLQERLRDQALVFADGHHRYESGLQYLETLRREGRDPGGAAFTLACFAPVPQPGLSILPTHRILHGLEPERLAALERGLEQSFWLRTVGRWRHEHDVERWKENAAEVPGRVLAMARRGDVRLVELTLKPDAAERVLAHLPTPLRELDVSVLHEVILRQVLGIGEAELSRQTHVRYRHEELGALEELEGDAQAVFLLRPTPIESVFRVAQAGLRMPQKSTFFYPKVATGFVLHRHQR